MRCTTRRLKRPVYDGKRGHLVKRTCALPKKHKRGRKADYRLRSHEAHEKAYKKARHMGWR